MEGYIAEIRMFGGNFPPRAWSFCQGQLVSIDQNTALFSLVGTTYGGDGITTFALPDLRGRASTGTGQGPGLPNMDLGQGSGSNSTTILTTQLPVHNHTVQVNNNTTGMATTAAGNYLNGTTGSGESIVAQGLSSAATLHPSTVVPTGGSQPIDIMQPYLGMNFIICMEGIYPSRN